MKKITIITGDSASMPQETIEKHELITVPFIVDWPEGVEIAGANIFEKMRNAENSGIKTIPKTSQPSIGVYKKAFEEILKDSEEIVCATISSKISGTYNSAMQAKKMLNEADQKRVLIFDTLNADASEGLFAIKAAELAKQGENGENILKTLQSMTEKVLLFGMLEKPKWLEAGGRISHTLAVILEKMQNIGMRPVLGIKKGVIKPVNLKIQAKDTANALLQEFEKANKKALEQKKRIRIAISHADNLSEAKKLEELVKEKYPQIEIAFINMTSIVIGAHVGPGALICCSMED